MADKTQAVLQQVKKVIIGKDDIVTKVFMSILSQGSILLDDVPGVGKTTLALAFRKALGLAYWRVQFTPDSVPSDIVGFSVYDRQTGEFTYKPGAAMTNLLLADEINRTSSKTQAALLEVMEEGSVTVDGVTHQVPKPFVVIATQNPVGSVGTQLLPHSQLDRFTVRLEMGYPDFQSQVDILRERHTENPLDTIQQVTTAQEILDMQQSVARVHIADAIYEYVTRLAQATREHALIRLGLSPRGALAVCRMAKARAFVYGRDYVVPEDVAAVFADVCGHRVMLYPKAKITQSTAAQILHEILGSTAMPGVKGPGDGK